MTLSIAEELRYPTRRYTELTVVILTLVFFFCRAGDRGKSRGADVLDHEATADQQRDQHGQRWGWSLRKPTPSED
jgi:hypothetical protein